ncbi:GNAT family N-acetyltransferase [Mesorhizobium sp. CN2-181]|uniref:GNAT family N-acetyltransferase n=1 Tax=Mesorhizobium yinganensis TaxID=3157707 RepID=UPI0032B7F852
MDRVIDFASPPGRLRLRPETEADRDFRFELFCASRSPEWQMVALEPTLFRQIMLQQFQAQTQSYGTQFPLARFDIVELDGGAVGRFVVDRRDTSIHVVDIAILPAFRRRGIGTALMTALIDQACRTEKPVRLMVASSNDPSMQFYLRLGFAVIETYPAYLEMEWRRETKPLP